MKQLRLILLAGTVMSGAVTMAFAEQPSPSHLSPMILAQAPEEAAPAAEGEVPPPRRQRGEAAPERQPRSERRGDGEHIRPQRPQREEGQARPERPSRADDQQRGERPQRPERQPRAEQPQTEERPQAQERPDRPARPERPQRPERPAPEPAPERQAPPPAAAEPAPPAAAEPAPPPAAAPDQPPIPRDMQRPDRRPGSQEQMREQRMKNIEERRREREAAQPGAGAPPPPASGETAPAPEAPSVAPAPPPRGEKPAIPPEELRGGQRTPEQSRRARQRADEEFRSRDRRFDQRFERKVEEQGEGRAIIREKGNRVIIRDGDRAIIRADQTERMRRNAQDVRTERRGNDNLTIIRRPGGVEIITENDRDGNLLRRIRREGGRETVLIDNTRAWERSGRWDRERGWRDRDRNRDRGFGHGGPHFDFFLDLPPVVVNIPRERYVLESEYADYDDYEEALLAPPLVRTERPYSLQEVTQNVRLRERVRSIDLNTVNFATGEWTLDQSQIDKLEDLARAMNAVIARNPNEVYLIEGHTDAVGSNIDNLSLSDRRAEEVAYILTEYYDVPAENLVTQGYGEDYLKVNTLAANAENRRVTVRNITQLMSAQAQ